MGSRLVGEVSVKFADVGYDAFRVLVHMANHALDTENGQQKARRYFGGQEVLARAMRPELPPEEDRSDEAKRAWKNALRDLRTAMEILVVCGAVTRTVKRPKPGERQEWDLTLRRKAAPKTAAMERRAARDAKRRAARKAELEALRQAATQVVSPPPMQVVSPPPNAGGVTPSAGGGVTPSPGATEEPREDKQQEPCGSGRASTTGPRVPATPKSETHTQMDPDTAARYRKAADALMTLADFGLGIRATIRDQLGQDAPEHEVVIRAAERFTSRRTG